MIAATLPIQRPPDGKLLVIDERGQIRQWARSRLIDLLRRGDLVVANDAATLPASLTGEHLPSGQPVEVRLAGRRSLAAESIRFPTAVVFGAGDFRVPTEYRPLPPPMKVRDRLRLGPLLATVEAILGHPRLVRLAFDGSVEQIWEGIARHGRPIQYSHIQMRPPPDSRWTGAFSHPSRSAGFTSERSPTRRASRPPATPNWMRCCRLTNHTTSRPQPLWPSAVPSR